MLIASIPQRCLAWQVFDVARAAADTGLTQLVSIRHSSFESCCQELSVDVIAAQFGACLSEIQHFVPNTSGSGIRVWHTYEYSYAYRTEYVFRNFVIMMIHLRDRTMCSHCGCLFHILPSAKCHDVFQLVLSPLFTKCYSYA